MAISNSRTHYPLQTKKPFSVLHLVTLIASFLLLPGNVNSQETLLSFNLTRFVPNQQDLIFQGDALISSSGVLQVTKTVNGRPVRGSTGRALYAAPLRIWDSNTGRATSFVTSFSFVVRAPTNQIADGIAFFLAPPDSEIPIGSGGGLLGLFNNRFYNSSRRTVAVEFDSCFNINWDPPGLYHIGIDVNSIQSTKTVPWDRRDGEIGIAYISYFAARKQLNVILTYPSSAIRHELFDVVDLKSVLPEWVRFGFSATTGLSGVDLESHDVLSWSFTAAAPSSSSVEDEMSLHDMLQLHLQNHAMNFAEKF